MIWIAKIPRLCIPIAIFAYIGVELVTVCAFEARNPKQLMRPAKNIAYVITAIYLVCIGGFVTNVEWFNQSLPLFLEQPLVAYPGSNDTSLGHTPWPFNHSSSRAYAAPVIAVLQVGILNLPGVIVGFLVYSGLSCGVTTLYVASRTLYGLTRDLSPTDPNWFVRRFATLNVISSRRHIPVWSLIVSLLAVAAWLPFIKLKSQLEQTEVSYL
jgi:amino acid transporter